MKNAFSHLVTPSLSTTNNISLQLKISSSLVLNLNTTKIPLDLNSLVVFAARDVSIWFMNILITHSLYDSKNRFAKFSTIFLFELQMKMSTG